MSVNMTNALILGEAGVGKTSTKCILFNKPPPQVRTSTPLAEAPVQIRLESPISQVGASHSGHRDLEVVGVKVQSADRSWNRMDDEQLEEIVADAITALIKNEDKDIDNQSHNISIRSLFASLFSIFKRQATSNSADSREDKSVSVRNDLQSAVAIIYGKMVDLAAKKKLTHLSRSPSEIFGSNWIYFIDSGGQPHFHNLLPHFVHGISVALFVHRLSKRLEEYPVVEYFENNQAIGDPYQSSISTEDTLKCLVRSMQSHTINDEKPKLVFIGTFLDKIQQSSESLQEKDKKLFKLLTAEFANQLVFSKKDLKSLIFPLNAKTPGVHEERMAELIRSAVESSPSRRVDVPFWWYVLQIILKKLSAQFDRMILSKQECIEVALQLNISKIALIEALKFFHDQHIFSYYSDILPDVVFTSPQVLLDKLTELVRQAYLMRENSSNTLPFDAPISGKWRMFRDQGILILEFLEQFRKHYVDNLFTPPDLLKIFMRHLIITPLLTDELHQEVDFTSHSIQYYMPSLLNVLSLATLESHRIRSPVTYPLLIRFPNGWPRAGVFCCLQVNLIQLQHWRIVFSEGKPKLIAQNCVMLSPPNSASRVTLIDSFSYLEIHVEAEADIFPKIYRVIRNAILTGIDVSCRTLRYSNDRPHLAFFCPCALTPPSSFASGPSQRHAAELFKEEGSLRCTIDETVTFKVDSRHSMWLQDSSKCV